MSNFSLLVTSRTLFQKKLSQHPRVKQLIEKSRTASENVANKSKTDDKPWPKSVRIAGYTGVLLAVPLTGFTFLSEFPSLREWVSGDDERPHDEQYHALGKKLVRFVEKYWTSNGAFENERYSDHQKISNLEIARMLDDDVPVELTVIDHRAGAPITFKLPASIPLDISKPGTIFTQSRLWLEGIRPGGRNGSRVESGSSSEESHLDSWLRSISENEGAYRVAIDFPEPQQNFPSEDLSQGHISYSDDGHGKAFASDGGGSDKKTTKGSPYAQHLLSTTHSFSTWHAHDEPLRDTTTGTDKNGKDSQSSVRDMRISELEWREAQLQADLIDPFCTKDIDEMQAELASVTRELRSLKRWRWASSLIGRRK